ncbi:MAG: hypothetical protein KF754_06705 [Planctomycetes bacterium]|nr:hypothetical protein [Planctomycetota bacterium]
MKPVPYKPPQCLEFGPVGQLAQARAGVETRDRTRGEIARFERHASRAWWCILWVPLAALGPFGLAHFCRWLVPGAKVSGFGLVSTLLTMLTFVWLGYNIVKSADCPWCGIRMADQPRIPRLQCCARCKQPLTRKAWDDRVPRENGGGAVPR